MAAGWLRHLAGDKVEVRSAGSEPAGFINPVAVQAMAEVGIDITANTPKLLTTEAVEVSDAVITMGCGDACPIFPGKRYEDWKLDDPAVQGIEAVRPIRDDIRKRIETLMGELLPETALDTKRASGSPEGYYMAPAKLAAWWECLTDDQRRAILAYWPQARAAGPPVNRLDWLPSDAPEPEPGEWAWQELAEFLHGKAEEQFGRGGSAR